MNTNQVDTAWETDFVVELRLLGVDGRHIGEALEQVRSHCVESGQDVHEAFGDPAAYARSLDLPTQDGGAARMLLSTAGGLIGMFLALWSFTAWLEGEDFALTVGYVAVAVVLALLAPLLLRYVRTVLEHPWRATLVAALVLTAVVAAPVLLPRVLAHLPALAVTTTGVALVIGTALWDHRARGDVDPVISPVNSADGAQPSTGTAFLTTWSLPIGTLLLLALAWVLDAAR